MLIHLHPRKNSLQTEEQRESVSPNFPKKVSKYFSFLRKRKQAVTLHQWRYDKNKNIKRERIKANVIPSPFPILAKIIQRGIVYQVPQKPRSNIPHSFENENR